MTAAATPGPDALRAVPAVLRTPRLRLVASDPAFAPEFARAMDASHDSLRFVSGWRTAADVEVAARSLARSVELAGQDVVRHAFEEATGAYVARLDLHSWDVTVPRCEIGYVGDARQRGRGLVREAALAMLELAWSLGAVRVQAQTDARNERALRFAHAIGLVTEGVLRHYERDDDGTLCDLVMLAVLRPQE